MSAAKRNPPICRLPHHSECLSSALNVLRQEGKFCDVTLVCPGGKKFAAHRNVLAASSQFFLEAFAQNGETRAELEVKTEPKILEVALEFVYTGKAQVLQEDVEAVMAAAHALKLVAIYEHCRGVVCDSMTTLSYHHVWQLADQFNDEILRQRAVLHAADNFPLISQEGRLSELNFAQVKTLLVHDELVVSSQDKLLEAVITWVKNKRDDREKHLSTLLSFVRFDQLSKPYLQMLVDKEEIVWESAELMRHITKTVCTRYLHGEDSLAPSPSDDSKSGDTSEETEVAIAVFGESEEKKIIYQCYSIQQDEWSPPEELPLQLTNTALVVLHDTVYLVGGKRENTYLKTVFLFSLDDSKVMEARGMHTERSHAGLGVLDGYIYAVGGYNSSGFLSSVERYSPTKDEWLPMASLSEAKGGVGVACLNKRLYAIGGRTGNSVAPATTVECYEPSVNQWSRVEPMLHARSHCGVAVLNQRIFVTGGYAKDTPSSGNIQSYDPVLRLWQEYPPPPAEDWVTAAVAFAGCLYVTTDGGQIFRYDLIRKIWSTCSLYPTLPGYYVASVLVNKPVWDT